MATTPSASSRLAPHPAGGHGADDFRWLADTADFPACWGCGRWSAGPGWLHIAADLAVAAALLAVPVALAWFLARRREVPFPGLLALAVAFGLSCGLGHALEALAFWHPVYRLAGVIKVVSAALSWATVAALIRALPGALRRPAVARSERALRTGEEGLAPAGRGTDRGIRDWGVDGGAAYHPPRLQELAGRAGDATSGTLDAWESRPHPEDRGRVPAAIADESGRAYWPSIDAQPIRDPAGAAANSIAVERDVTERRRGAEALRRAHDELEARVRGRTAELEAQAAALRRAEEDYRSIFENAAEGIFQTTPGGRYLRANPALAKIYGYESAAELAADLVDVGRQLYVEPGRREAFRRLVEEQGTVAGFESLVRRKDGGLIWIREAARAVRGPDGAVCHYEGMVEDITERRRAVAEIRDLNAHLECRLARIAALRRIDLAIADGPDLGATLGVVLDQVLEQLGVAAAAVRLRGPAVGGHPPIVARGVAAGALAGAPLTPGEGAAGVAVLQRRVARVDDLHRSDDPLARAIRAAGGQFAAYRAVPLVAKGEVLGVLEVLHPAAMPEDPDWCGYLEALAGQAAIAVDNVALFEGLQRSNAELALAYDATIEGWARALDLRDKETEGHTRRVTEMALRLARALGLGGEDLVHVRRGALLHDIGKLGVPDAVLLKPGKLNDEEWAVMRRHPDYAHEWLSPIAFLRPALEIPYGHHERWDGAGYPQGLRGAAIPLAARLFAAVDIWDALRSDRPYRAAWAEGRVREHLRALSGTHLDPAVVAAFLRVLDEGEAVEPPPAGTVATAGPTRPAPAPSPPAGRCRVAERVRELEAANARLVELAATDELTGLGNRRNLRSALEAALADAARHARPLSLVLLDLDGFKAFNDAHGHPAGDGTLQAVAGALRAHVRPGDVAARYGGEEFAVLMPGAETEGARTCAERLRAAIAGHLWPLRPVTASFGVATLTPGGPAADLVEQADRALYRAKRLGRDRVVHHEDLAAPAERRPHSMA